MRAFFALLPDAELSRSLDAWALRNYPTTGRRVSMQNLHMTVCFLGDIDAAQQTFFDEALRSVVIEPITFHLNDFGYFSKSQVLWLGSKTTPAAFKSLADRCQRIANRAGIRVDKRPQIPHITLARRVLPSVPSPLEPAEFMFKTNTLHLQESRLTPDGPQYRTVLSWPNPALST